jgi:glycyl-tRNA synthetase alpha chain
MECTQFTYFQQVGGQVLNPISAEITYGLERLAMHPEAGPIFDIEWNAGVTYGEITCRTRSSSRNTTSRSPTATCCSPGSPLYENEFKRLNAEGLALPAYDYVMKCSHTFNLLDARSAISVTERQGYIGRIRDMARKVADLYVKKREALGYPMLRGAGKRAGNGE